MTQAMAAMAAPMVPPTTPRRGKASTTIAGASAIAGTSLTASLAAATERSPSSLGGVAHTASIASTHSALSGAAAVALNSGTTSSSGATSTTAAVGSAILSSAGSSSSSTAGAIGSGSAASTAAAAAVAATLNPSSPLTGATVSTAQAGLTPSMTLGSAAASSLAGSTATSVSGAAADRSKPKTGNNLTTTDMPHSAAADIRQAMGLERPRSKLGARLDAPGDQTGVATGGSSTAGGGAHPAGTEVPRQVTSGSALLAALPPTASAPERPDRGEKSKEEAAPPKTEGSTSKKERSAKRASKGGPAPDAAPEMPYGASADIRQVQNSLNRVKTSVAKGEGGGSENEEVQHNYQAERVLGSGSFGVVYEAKVVETGEIVAIKKVLQDRRYKNRELSIMQELRHPNIVEFRHAFHTPGDKPGENYLHVVMEYCSETVHHVMKHYAKMRQPVPVIFVQLYTYQMLRGVAHMHAEGICHRDIKPQNLLIDGHTHALKICDFGSAKRLSKGEPNVAYICSRFYRAPELIFGATDYSTLIDMWSVACVSAELIQGKVLFPGDSGIDQLMEIIKILGTPTRDDLSAMNPNYSEFKFPQIKSFPWTKVFQRKAPPEAIDYIAKMLQYNPMARPTGLQACMHPFFDDLRNPETRICNTKPLPGLLHWFSDAELGLMRKDERAKLIPSWVTIEQGGPIPRHLAKEPFWPPGFGPAGSAASASGERARPTSGGGSEGGRGKSPRKRLSTRSRTAEKAAAAAIAESMQNGGEQKNSLLLTVPGGDYAEVNQAFQALPAHVPSGAARSDPSTSQDASPT